MSSLAASAILAGIGLFIFMFGPLFILDMKDGARQKAMTAVLGVALLFAAPMLCKLVMYAFLN